MNKKLSVQDVDRCVNEKQNSDSGEMQQTTPSPHVEGKLAADETSDGQSYASELDLNLLPYEIAESLPTLGGRFGELAALCKWHVAAHIEKMIKAKQSGT